VNYQTFRPGETVIWRKRCDATRQYPDGPFQIARTESIRPISYEEWEQQKTQYEQIYGAHRVNQRYDQYRGVGHPQWVYVVIDGKERCFSGQYFTAVA
jgi:hypothetical protein